MMNPWKDSFVVSSHAMNGFVPPGRSVVLPSPDQIFELSQRDPVVRHYVLCWRTGGLTWEQMLGAVVIELAKRHVEFTKIAVDRLSRVATLDATNLTLAAEAMRKIEDLGRPEIVDNWYEKSEAIIAGAINEAIAVARKAGETRP